MATPQITNANGAYGETSTGLDRSALQQVFAAATAISAGNLVSLSTDGNSIIKCLTDGAARAVIGVALEDIAAGDVGSVCIYGPALATKEDVAVTAGDVLTRSASTTAGVTPVSQTAAVTQVKDTYTTIGVAMASATAGDSTVRVYVAKQ